ncbi:MAG: GEVED domain-containing protein [Bacteroidia bacterium]|nr:GEVED domain-containing protein [Bacteroidia bacterium]
MFTYLRRVGLSLLLLAMALPQVLQAQSLTFPRVKDDPAGRAAYEYQMLIDPATGRIPADIREKELGFVYADPNLSGAVRATGATWVNRGPYNVGGRTRALAIDVTNENILLAGGVSGGMWRSVNGGSSWAKTTGSSELHSVTCLAQDPRAGFTSTWYYATGEGYGNSASATGAAYRGNGVYKSTDGGLTWVNLSATAADPTVFSGNFQYNWNIVVNPVNGDVYAATGAGIFRSQNGGTSWANVLDGGTSSLKYTDIAVTTTGVLYATISSTGTPNKGIFRSTDGTTWTAITPTGFATTYSRIVVGIAPSNQNVVYFFANTPGVGTSDHSFYKYTYVSGNGSGTGGTWVNRSTTLPAYGGSVGNLSQGSYNQYVKVKPDNENVVFIGSTNVYRSTDGFATTTNTRWIGGYSPANDVSRYPSHHPDNHAMVFFPSNPASCLSGHDGGISKTTNNLGNTAGNQPVVWTELNNGYLTTQVYGVAIDPLTSGDTRIMAGFQDNGKWYSSSSNGTTPWIEELGGGDGCYVAIVPTATTANRRYTSTQNGKILRFDGPNPQSPTDYDQIHPSTATGQLFVNPYILDPNNANIMYYAGGTRVWRNSNLAGINSGYGFTGTTTNWTNMTGTAVTTGTVSALAVSTTAANVLYYGTSDGQVYRVDNANSGTGTKVNIYTGKGFPAGAYVSAIAVDPTNAANAIVAFSNYGVKSLFYTTNSGSTWTDISGNLEQNADGTGNGPSVRWVSIHKPTAGGTFYFVGASTGLYVTEVLNGTATVWTAEGTTSIGNVVVHQIATRQSDGLVAIGTHANGIFSGTVTGTPAPCDVSSGLSSSAVTSSTATLSWAAVSGAVTYDLQYRVNGTTTWTSVSGLSGTSYNAAGLAASTTYEFQVRTNCAGGSSAFSASSTFTTSAPTACGVPAGLSSSAITSSTATLSWGAVSGAVSYDLQYRVNGTTTWTSVTGLTGISYNATGLTASTTYEFQVRTNCSGSSSTFSASATFTTAAPPSVTYCTSQGNSTADEWLNRVRIGSIDNTSGNNGGYGNFTSLSTNLTRGVSASIILNPAWSGTAFREAYNVWIDYNQDGDFTDAGEAVYSRSRTTATQSTGTFTVPTTATLGATRMRVSMKYNANATSCEIFSFGEVEDYTVNIVAAGSVIAPSVQPALATTADILALYPNPASESATLVLYTSGTARVSVLISNLQGQGVRSAGSHEFSGEHQFKLDLQGISAGIYFVYVVTEDGSRQVRKLVVE